MNRTDHEHNSGRGRLPIGVGPALLTLVILAALPAALACAREHSPLLEAAELIEHSRRAGRPESACAREGGGHDRELARGAAKTKPAAMSLVARACTGLRAAEIRVGARASFETLRADAGLRWAVRAGFGATPPPAR